MLLHHGPDALVCLTNKLLSASELVSLLSSLPGMFCSHILTCWPGSCLSFWAQPHREVFPDHLVQNSLSSLSFYHIMFPFLCSTFAMWNYLWNLLVWLLVAQFPILEYNFHENRTPDLFSSVSSVPEQYAQSVCSGVNVDHWMKEIHCRWSINSNGKRGVRRVWRSKRGRSCGILESSLRTLNFVLRTLRRRGKTVGRGVMYSHLWF